MTRRSSDDTTVGGVMEHLFVYGTLRPGDVRWRLLQRFVADRGIEDTATGAVFDTGLDFPAAMFGTAGTIIGRTYALRTDRLAEALALLDEEEGSVAGLFERVRITTGRDIEAWAYAYGGGLDLSPIPSGDWFDRPPRPGGDATRQSVGRAEGHPPRTTSSEDVRRDRGRGPDLGHDPGTRPR